MVRLVKLNIRVMLCVGDHVTVHDITDAAVSKNLLIGVTLSLQAKFFTHDRLHIIYAQDEFGSSSGYIMSVQ